MTFSRLEEVLSLVSSAVSLVATPCSDCRSAVRSTIKAFATSLCTWAKSASVATTVGSKRVWQNRTPPPCDDDMVRYFLSQLENGRKSDSETHSPTHGQRRTEKERTTSTGTSKEQSVTYTVKQTGKGTRPYSNICLPPWQVAPVNPLMLLAVMAKDWATPFGSRKQHLCTLERTCPQHPPKYTFAHTASYRVKTSAEIACLSPRLHSSDHSTRSTAHLLLASSCSPSSNLLIDLFHSLNSTFRAARR